MADATWTMKATFKPTLDVWKLLEGEPSEYIVVNPMMFEVRLKDGEVMRYPQDIRERIVRCRDCEHGDPFCECSSYPGKINCLHFAQWNHYDDEPGVCVMEPSDFCSYGVMRDGD